MNIIIPFNNTLKYLVFTFVLSCATIATSQKYDECRTAFPVVDATSYCSSVGFFSLNGVSPSGFGPATCFDEANPDIWISFVASARDVTVIGQGATAVDPKGTLRNIDMALYEGSCTGTIKQLSCASGTDAVGISELYQGGLTFGRTYYIRVQSSSAETGTFQLCIRNYNPSNDPKSDCQDGVIICNKDPIVVQKVIGGGVDNQELQGVPCGLGVEQSSTWYKFICGESGTLEFTITPLNITDDLDFALFRLPNGINDCSNKESIRCMAAGESVDRYPSPCHGPTGLREGNDDINENPGCDEGQNNFIAPANLVSGEAYALVINNFTSTGTGLEIEWGGTATFQGPEPIVTYKVDDERLCYENAVEFIATADDTEDMIVQWNWYFGENSSPQSATGPGPHIIDYSKAGDKLAILEVRTARGCLTTVKTPIELVCCDITESISLTGNTEIELGESSFLMSEVILKGTDIDYLWTPVESAECPRCQDTNVFPRQSEVTYTLNAVDEFGCSISDSITIYVEINYNIYVPNAFSPNLDGANDYYTVYSNLGAERLNYLRVFNRWGDKVYEVKNAPVGDVLYGWDGTFRGKPVAPGIYAMNAQLVFLDGKVENVSGEIHVIR